MPNAVDALKLAIELEKQALGKYKEAIPHVTNEIKDFIVDNTKNDDVVLCEIGGTVGDIEGLPFLEAIRQLRNEMGKEKAIIISTHILEEVDAVCTRACIIAKGKKIVDKKPNELKKLFKNKNLDNIFRKITLNK